MTAQGDISRIELITWATRQMEEIDQARNHIDEEMNGQATLDKLETLYAASRELGGQQKILRSMLVFFDANMVLPPNREKGMANTEGCVEFGVPRKGFKNG